nr:unnamed protein product [Digitaria exilis]
MRTALFRSTPGPDAWATIAMGEGEGVRGGSADGVLDCWMNHNHGPVPPRKLDSRPSNKDCDPMEEPRCIEVDPVEEPFEGMEFESEEAAKLFYEAIKFAKEGSVTEQVYNVAVSALKEAAEKVKTMSALQSSNQVDLETTPSGDKVGMPQKITSSNQAIHGKDEGVRRPSEETMVAIPAIPLALCMPMTHNFPGSSADGPYRLLAAPIQAVPISYRPAEPLRQAQKGVCALGPFAGVLSELNKRGTGPNSLVHATALACGARVVPLEEAASLINAVESKIRSGGAIIAKLPSSNLISPIPRAITMSSSSEDEENDHSGPLMVDVDGNCHDQSSDEMKLQSEPSGLETEADN